MPARSKPLTLIVSVQVRDITTDPKWERAYGLVIPVLTCADVDGSNEVCPGQPLQGSRGTALTTILYEPAWCMWLSRVQSSAHACLP